jgi:hypothetical protein
LVDGSPASRRWMSTLSRRIDPCGRRRPCCRSCCVLTEHTVTGTSVTNLATLHNHRTTMGLCHNWAVIMQSTKPDQVSMASASSTPARCAQCPIRCRSTPSQRSGMELARSQMPRARRLTQSACEFVALPSRLRKHSAHGAGIRFGAAQRREDKVLYGKSQQRPTTYRNNQNSPLFRGHSPRAR